MNKQIEELAYIAAVAADKNVCNQHSFNAGRKSVLDELTKQEPVFMVFDGPPGPVAPRFIEVETPAGFSIKVGGWNAYGDYWTLGPLYEAPIPAPDLVAEIDRLKAEYVKELDLVSNRNYELRQQLSAAQQDNDALVKVLRDALSLSRTHVLVSAGTGCPGANAELAQIDAALATGGK